MIRAKRIISVLLAVLMAMNIAVLDISAEKTVDTDRQIRIEKLLGGLGIISGELSDESKLTRAGAAKLIWNMGRKLCPKNEAAEECFRDVSESTEYAEEINTLFKYGILSGYNGYFRPKDIITGEEFMVAVMQLAGYKEIAEMGGGYAEGYYKRVNSALQGLAMHSELTYKTAYEMTYELLLLNIPVISEFNANGNVSYKISEDDTLLEYLFEVEEYEGEPVANEYIALGGRTRVGDGDVVIRNDDGKEYVYNCEDSDIADYFGITIRYFVSDDTIMCYIPKREAKVLTVQNEDIVKVNRAITEITYETESGRSKTIKLSPDIDFVYNGTSTFDVSADNFMKYDGYAEFVDADNDGEYDIVKIWNFEAYFVGYVSKGGRTISDINTGRTIELDEESGDYDLYIEKFGAEFSFDEIEKYNVVSVAESNEDTGKRLISAYVSDYTVEGSIAYVDDETVGVDDEILKVAIGCDLTGASVGAVGIFGISVHDKLVSVYLKNQSEISYAYLLRASSVTESELGREAAMIRVMEQNSEIGKHYLSEKFYLNGEKCEISGFMTALTSNNETVQQLISYKLDKDGNIKYLYYAPNPNEGITQQKEKYSLVCNRTFNDKSLRFLIPKGVIDGTYYMDTATPVFRIITDADGNMLEDMSGVVNYSTLATESGYRFNISFYDADEKQEPAVALMKFKSSEWSSWYKAPVHAIAVSRVRRESDEDNDVVTKLYGYDNGREVTYLLDEAMIDINELRKGDMVLAFTNGKKLISTIPLFRLHCDSYSDRMLYGDYAYNASKPATFGDNNDSYGKSSIYSCCIGRISKTFDNGILFVPDGTTESRRYELTDTYAVYELETDGSYKAKAQSDLTAGSGKVMLHTRYGVAVDIVYIN